MDAVRLINQIKLSSCDFSRPCASSARVALRRQHVFFALATIYARRSLAYNAYFDTLPSFRGRLAYNALKARQPRLAVFE